MKNLFQYILESLVNFNELREKMSFEDCSWKDIKKILLTDEYNYAKDLGFKGTEESLDDEVFLGIEEDSHYFKIIYNKKVLGVFGIYYLKDWKNINSMVYEDIITSLFNSSKLLSEYDYTFDNIVKDSAYIILWQLSSKEKKELDINPIALVKVLYEKLEQKLKKEHIKVIGAHGKNEKMKKSYIKVGGFEDYSNKYLTDYTKKLWGRINSDIYENFVIKKI